MYLQVQSKPKILQKIEPLLQKHNIDVFQGFDVTDDGENPREYVEAWEDDFNNFIVEYDNDYKKQIDVLKWVIVNLLDGVKEHDLRSSTGLPESDCQKIWEIYKNIQK